MSPVWTCNLNAHSQPLSESDHWPETNRESEELKLWTKWRKQKNVHHDQTQWKHRSVEESRKYSLSSIEHLRCRSGPSKAVVDTPPPSVKSRVLTNSYGISSHSSRVPKGIQLPAASLTQWRLSFLDTAWKSAGPQELVKHVHEGANKSPSYECRKQRSTRHWAWSGADSAPRSVESLLQSPGPLCHLKQVKWCQKVGSHLCLASLPTNKVNHVTPAMAH